MSGTREFSLALLGYDRRQVDAFRDEMDAVIGQLHGRIDELEAELERVQEAKPITADRAFATVARETERILQTAQRAGARIVDEAREQAETALARARDERAQIIGDGHRVRDEMGRQLRELASTRDSVVHQLTDAVTAIERVTAQLDAAMASDTAPAATDPQPARALTGTDQRRFAAAAGPSLRVIRGEDHRGEARPPAPAGGPPMHPTPRGRTGGADPFAARRQHLASLRAAVTDLLASELAALRDRLREQVRSMPDARGIRGIGFDPAAVADIADAVSLHLRRAFELGAGSVAHASDQRPPSLDGDVEDLDRLVAELLRRHVGEPLQRLLADSDREDAPPWLVVERIDGAIADESTAMVAEIAETALSSAYERGRLATWVDDDIPARRWIVNPRRHRADGGCRTNADAGAVPIGTPFPSGELTPPRHDGCTCTTIAATEESSP